MKKKRKERRLVLLEIEVSVYSLIYISKLPVRCMDNVVMFYEKKIW